MEPPSSKKARLEVPDATALASVAAAVASPPRAGLATPAAAAAAAAAAPAAAPDGGGEAAPVSLEAAQQQAAAGFAKAGGGRGLRGDKVPRKMRGATAEQQQVREWTHLIHQAAKGKDLHTAMAILKDVVAAAATLPPPVYSTLLFLACGGDQWEKYARSQPIAAPEPREGAEPVAVPTVAELAEAADRVYTIMRSANVAMDQTGYVSMARLEAMKGNPKKALEWLVECQGQKYPVQLRLYHPSLVGYAMAGDVVNVLEIDAMITANKLDKEEYEFARLVEAMANGGTYEQLRAVLLQMSAELNCLQPTTVDFILGYFRSPRGAAALAEAASPATGDASAGPLAACGPDARWHVEECQVDAAGLAPVAGEALKVVDLADSEWEQFLSGVSTLATAGSAAATNTPQADGSASAASPQQSASLGDARGREFTQFQEWVDRHGPFEVLIDSANVAYYGQNRPNGGFCWAQIIAMYEAAKVARPGGKVLMLLHKRRTMDNEARHPAVQAFLAKVRESKEFYHSPPGSNDDWYWLYATVHAKGRGVLISNDEMRDHIFTLLRPKHFLKWKVNHIMHYTFTMARPVGDPVLTPPPAYSPCIQELSSGGWMVPTVDDSGAWWCVKPVPAAAAATSPQ